MDNQYVCDKINIYIEEEKEKIRGLKADCSKTLNVFLEDESGERAYNLSKEKLDRVQMKIKLLEEILLEIENNNYLIVIKNLQNKLKISKEKVFEYKKVFSSDAYVFGTIYYNQSIYVEELEKVLKLIFLV